MKIASTTVKPSDSRHSRVYVSPENETVLEHLASRHSRPHETYHEVVLPEVERIAGRKVRLEWSQYAGCCCPCSPGFIVRGASIVKDEKPIDIFIGVSPEDDPEL